MYVITKQMYLIVKLKRVAFQLKQYIMQWEAQSEKVNTQETLVSANQKNHPRDIHHDRGDWSPKL